MKFTGKITDYLETQGTSKKGEAYIVRKWRIEETEGQYPNSIMVESYNKDFGNVKEGDTVDVDFNCKCDKYEGKLYNKFSAWKMSLLAQDTREQAPPVGANGYTGPTPDWAKPGGTATSDENATATVEGGDGLPF